jgi:hypothetical protein
VIQNGWGIYSIQAQVLAGAAFTAALSKLIFRYRFTRSYYHQALSSAVARNHAGSDVLVLRGLVDEAVEQQYRWAIVIHTVLLRQLQQQKRGGADVASSGMTAREVVCAVQALLAKCDADTAATGDSDEGYVCADELKRAATVESVECLLKDLMSLGLWLSDGHEIGDRGGASRDNVHPPAMDLHGSTTQSTNVVRWRAVPLEDADLRVRDCWNDLLTAEAASQRRFGLIPTCWREH